MSRLCYKNMFMKDHSSFVSCILSFSLTTVSETSIRGFYYLSISVVMKLGFIDRQDTCQTYCLGSVLLRKLKIKSEREILSSRGHCLIFIHEAGVIYLPVFFILEIGKKEKNASNCLGIVFFFFHSLQLSGPVSYVRSL